MGQSASKTVGQSAGNVVKKAAKEASKSGLAATPGKLPPSLKPPTTTAANPGDFLRGGGIAQQDIRDVGQEMFLQTMHKVDDEEKAKGPPEMPDDLIRFIQDVGPAKQAVDKDFTAPRLLEKENEKELQKVESNRKVIRERKKMPLMGDLAEEGDNFTTVRNTNFTEKPEEKDNDFGATDMQFFEMMKSKSKNATMDKLKEDTYDKLVEDPDVWTDKERQTHLLLLEQTMKSMDLPVLRMDSDGNVIGLHSEDVPGPEVKAIKEIPTNKLRLVLDDIFDRENEDGAEAIELLSRRRDERKRT